MREGVSELPTGIEAQVVSEDGRTGGRSGYRTKNKNPTRQCGEKCYAQHRKNNRVPKWIFVAPCWDRTVMVDAP